MNNRRIAKELIEIASVISAANKVSLQDVADIVEKGNDIFSTKGKIEAVVGRKNIDMVNDGSLPSMYVRIDGKATEKGRPIIVISKKGADPDSDDIVVNGFVVGYL